MILPAHLTSKEAMRTMNTIPIRPLMTLKFLTLAALTLAWLLLSGCNRWVGERGNGNITAQDREIQNFTTLQADGAFEVNWTSGPPRLTIRTDENLLEFIRTEVSGGKLTIDWSRSLRSTEGIKVEVASESLRAVELNGAVRMTAEQLAGPELVLEANGATRVTLSGSVNAISATMNGASRLHAEALETRAAELEINGAGRADINASEVLRVAVSGAGRVNYVGDPQVHKEISGAGSVRRRQ
ncbi:hypothetical protein BH20VER2_BH20VER2_14910 [soil metagenome]